MHKLVCYIFLCFPFTGIAQDYIAYQRIFNRADEDIISNDSQTASSRFDTIYNNYHFIYANHCVKALQTACALNDSIRADKWLAKCFMQGVPRYLLTSHTLTNKAFHYTNTVHTVQAYDSLRAIYKASYNHSITKTIDSLMVIDQRRTQRVNHGFIIWRIFVSYPRWVRNNKKEYRVLEDIITRYGYPGERLIGLSADYEDSAWVVKSTTRFGANIFERRAQTMLMHYYSNPRKDINGKLTAEVVRGYLPPWQFAIFGDFLHDNGRKKDNYKPNGQWFPENVKSDTAAVNSYRGTIGLNTFEAQLRNYKMTHERVANKTANSEIRLE